MTLNTESLTQTSDPATTEHTAAEHTAAEHTAADHTSIWDQLGIAGSVLCLIHCLATPFAIGYLSTAGFGLLGHNTFHKVLALILLTIALFAFGPGFRRHKNPAVLGVGALGILLLVGTGFILAPFHFHDLELGLTITGSLLLVGAHTANWRLLRQHRDCCD